MKKKKVLYLLRRYPQISETYIETEIRHLCHRYELRILALRKADIPSKSHHPYMQVAAGDSVALENAILEFAPDFIHGHYMHHAPELSEAARIAGAPFTVRAHSYDVLGEYQKKLPSISGVINDDACAGVVTFPFARDTLAQAGIRDDKIHVCYPVVDFERFHDETPNGDAAMNVGACLPKKNHELFLSLATENRHRMFNLYAMGYGVEQIRALDHSLGCPVNIAPLMEHEEMPYEYKKHEWLIYTASQKVPTVGWPMAIAEAQASGVGVCMQNIRPDLREYVGPAGFLFETVAEVADIISKPFPEDLRQIGFEHAKKSDVSSHVQILENLWKGAE